MRRFIARRQGSTTLEFALVTPLVLLMFMGFIQAGLLLSSYVSVTNVAREAARAAVEKGLTDAQRVTAAQNAVYTGDGTTGRPTGIALGVGYIPAGGVTVALPAYTPGADLSRPYRQGQTLTVTVRWTSTMRLGGVVPMPTINLVAMSKMRIE